VRLFRRTLSQTSDNSCQPHQIPHFPVYLCSYHLWISLWSFPRQNVCPRTSPSFERTQHLQCFNSNLLPAAVKHCLSYSKCFQAFYWIQLHRQICHASLDARSRLTPHPSILWNVAPPLHSPNGMVMNWNEPWWQMKHCLFTVRGGVFARFLHLVIDGP